MKLFSCPSCSQVVFFENVLCERCSHALGYEPESNRMLALEPEEGIWVSAGRHSDGSRWKYCGNYEFGVCNWLIPGDSADTFCKACRHNLTVPDASNPANVANWQRMEIAKRRMVYTLLRLRLPLFTRDEAPEGLGFDFLAETPGEQHVMTGHDDGLITIALVEADDAEREKRRTSMGEPYRTLLGHFRHEVGHWYWDRLVRDGGALAECRAIFGNDEVDYGEALQTHYRNGPKPNWQDEYVSSYAASHAWEDFAETWSHYLHIVDSLETGHWWGVSVDPRVKDSGLLTTTIDFDVFAEAITIEDITDAWLALSAALNSFNRSMGHNDLYPFVLSETVRGKLGFIHDLVHFRLGNQRANLPQAAQGAAAGG
ncbi:putative zinc-binding metallopeptidase [Aurantimonas sp. VKM B-3413]|uniref:zinc-binding metallopeptidase family protein n=1 Tax=Aurantimonas sp. VKM B-3413 TaxID=2779401 RepID=UPI001E3DB8EF|nr:putative zinc-binding peptidase [Aurantimonas sp. VKM B-3413]MCB8839054.1 putative zinc-binding peptidase [Aurantimonas sp. VKM B-3413]